jgi:hypothetical protein
MSDFTPEVRNQALWSGDARRFVEGRGGEVYAEKIGVKPRRASADGPSHAGTHHA